MSSDLRTRPHTTTTGMTTAGTGAARTMSIIGFVCAVLAVFVVPLLGIAAIMLGVIAYKKGDRLGMWAAVAGAVGLVVGMILGAAVIMANNGGTGAS